MLVMSSVMEISKQTCPPFYKSLDVSVGYFCSSGTTLVAINAIDLSNNKPTNPT